MPRRQLAALILASALVTLDGSAATIALPAIGRDLSASMSRLQWIINAPLLALAALLLPAGALADRFGRIRVLRTGVIAFVGASAIAAAAWSDVALIGARLAQGAAGALVLPAALAVLRAAYADAAERTRVLGVWAAWTGAASAAGPLLAAVLLDATSWWRAVFLPSVLAGFAAIVLLRRDAPTNPVERAGRVPVVATVALTALLGALAYFLMQGSAAGFADRLLLPAALAIAGAIALVRDPQRQVLFPRELLSARNCLPANATTFALYFGMFGMSFLLVLYVQQVLGHSALWSALVVLPISIMLLFAERFGRLTASFGTRPVVLAGALAAAAGLAWIASAPHPAPFWSHLIAGAALFGSGLSLAVSALTHAAVAAVPENCAGAASGLNHAMVRAAGVMAVALLGSIAAPGQSHVISAEGFQRALVLCAVVVAAGGFAGSAQLRDNEAGGVAAQPAPPTRPRG
jgi:MFS family permease